MKKLFFIFVLFFTVGCTTKEYIYRPLPLKGIDPKLRDLHTFEFDYLIVDVGGGDYNVTMHYWDAKRIAAKLKRCVTNNNKCKACCDGYRKQIK